MRATKLAWAIASADDARCTARGAPCRTPLHGVAGGTRSTRGSAARLRASSTRSTPASRPRTTPRGPCPCSSGSTAASAATRNGGGASGIRRFAERADEEGFILLCPSAQAASAWWTHDGTDMILGALDDLMRRAHVDVDPRRGRRLLRRCERLLPPHGARPRPLLLLRAADGAPGDHAHGGRADAGRESHGPSRVRHARGQGSALSLRADEAVHRRDEEARLRSHVDRLPRDRPPPRPHERALAEDQGVLGRASARTRKAHRLGDAAAGTRRPPRGVGRDRRRRPGRRTATRRSPRRPSRRAPDARGSASRWTARTKATASASTPSPRGALRRRRASSRATVILAVDGKPLDGDDRLGVPAGGARAP